MKPVVAARVLLVHVYVCAGVYAHARRLGMKSAFFSQFPGQAAQLLPVPANQRKGVCCILLLAPLLQLPWCPGRLLFYCLCWRSDKHFPPPAVTVAPPETTAGGGAASSAPHPLILHLFQAPAQSPARQTPPRQGPCTVSELAAGQKLFDPAPSSHS